MNESAPLKLPPEILPAEPRRKRERPPAPPAFPPPPLRRARRRLSLAQVLFLLLVAAPSGLAALYTWLVATDVYVSEARFWVRGQKAPQSSLLAPMLGLPGNGASLEETLSIQDYVLSHDAVAALDERIGLRRLYSSPDVDYFNRLRQDARLEAFVDYHRTMVDARHNTQSGLITLRALGYRPAQAKQLLAALIELSEELINRFNDRAHQEALRVARAEVKIAEERVARVREEITAFRDRARTIDPSHPTASVVSVIAGLEAKLAQTRTELTEAESYLAPDSQQVKTLRTRITAILGEIEREKGRLTGDKGALAPVIAEYEKLQLQREFADKGLASALVSLETARTDAQRQQLFIVRVVSPNEPERADWMSKWRFVILLFFGSLLAYGIGALVVAGVRDRVV
jgi:capsular polysaccharide transport system permease protein